MNKTDRFLLAHGVHVAKDKDKPSETTKLFIVLTNVQYHTPFISPLRKHAFFLALGENMPPNNKHH